MAQDASNTAQDGSKTAQDGPMTAQDVLETANDGLQTAHESPKTAKERSKRTPSRARSAPSEDSGSARTGGSRINLPLEIIDGDGLDLQGIEVDEADKKPRLELTVNPDNKDAR